jgi:DNA-binding NarL/FixJ family response regulator
MSEIKVLNSLTPRQRQILDIVATRGISNKSIARMLHISESTVKLHMSGILKKFGLRNRTQLALFARDNALKSSLDLKLDQITCLAV